MLNDNKILQDIKSMLGLSDDVTDFDTDLIIYINGSLSALSQLHRRLPSEFQLETGNETWNDYLTDGTQQLFGLVKVYISTTVRINFDPPTSTVLKNALDKSLEEVTWRLSVIV